MSDEKQPEAAADKAPGATPAEPLKGEVSRTDDPGAGASAAPAAEPKAGPPAPKPENPAAAATAAISEASSATGEPTKEADAVRKAPPPLPTRASGPAAPKPAAPEGEAKAGPPPPPPRAGGPPPPPPRAAAAPGAKPAPKPAAGGEAHKPAPAAPPAGPPDPAPPATAEVPGYLTALQSAIPGGVQLSYWVGDWTVIVPTDRLEQVARYLRDTPDAAFDLCADATATDWPGRAAKRFDVVYCLYSTRHRRRVRIKTQASETDPVPSMTVVWPAANWLEREVYDLFGVNFVNHPDRRRILMPDDWQGFPQRKDYPLEGPGELLMENPLDWLKLRQARDEADIE
jgi:NADH-quinone oxidoreductase subunit C